MLDHCTARAQHAKCGYESSTENCDYREQHQEEKNSTQLKKRIDEY
jgi:hypothetical protein